MMKPRGRASVIAGSLLPLLVICFGCRSEPTTASRSAAAYDEAVQKGAPVKPGEAHGQHGQAGGPTEPETPGAAGAQAMPGMDHSQMAGQGQEKAPGGSMKAMDHSTMPVPKRGGGMAGMDHSAMGHGSNAPMKGMDHSAKAGSSPAGGMAGMDHSAMGHGSSTPSTMKGMDHSAMGHQAGMPTTMTPPKPEPATATATSQQPRGTLRPDANDGPAATSISDAERSAAMAAEMAGGGHGMQHGTYKQTDAGRESLMPQAPQQPQPSPTADPHRMHGAPAPRPTPPPLTGHQGHTPAPPQPKSKPSPTPDPHLQHGASPSPTAMPVARKDEDRR